MITKDKYMNKVSDLVEDHFPKGQCKERGEVMVLVAMILKFLMDEGLVEDEDSVN